MWPFNRSSSSISAAEEEEITDADIQKFLAQASLKSADSCQSSNCAASVSARESERNLKDESGKEEPCNLQYYFDEFFMCYTPKSQLRNWYRYGEKKDCAERWQDFKACMRTRMTDEEDAQVLLKERRLNLEERVHSRPNSEDIWQIRQENLDKPWQQHNDTAGYSIS